MVYIHQMISYWDRQKDISSKAKMEGISHSILCALDGVSGSFDGNIKKLEKAGRNLMLHDHFYK